MNIRDILEDMLIKTKKLYYWALVSILISPSVATSYEEEIEDTSEQITRLLEAAKSYIGRSYRYGSSNSIKTDCSGLMQQVFSSIGIKLSRSSKEQFSDERFVDVPFALRRSGDLIFFKNTYKKGISHVALMIDEDNFIHASFSQRKVVVEKISNKNKLLKKFHGLKRMRITNPDFYFSKV
jgi:cell wall-associated NlpC family hydrolase